LIALRRFHRVCGIVALTAEHLRALIETAALRPEWEAAYFAAWIASKERRFICPEMTKHYTHVCDKAKVAAIAALSVFASRADPAPLSLPLIINTHRRLARNAGIVFVIAVTVVLMQSRAVAQSVAGIAQPFRLSVNSHRPLADMLDKIQVLYKTPINFEEAPYQYSGDIEFRTISTKSGSAHYATPVGGQLNVTLDEHDSNALQAVQSVVNAYSMSGLPGAYTVVQVKGRIYVVPVQTRGTSGTIQSITAMMNQQITIPVAERPVQATIEMLVDGLSKVSGQRVVLLDEHLPDNVTVQLGANNESFRDIMYSFTEKIGQNLYFRLLYAPNDKTYYLNLEAVARAPVGGFSTAKTPLGNSPVLGKEPVDNPFFIKK
jgi:hypothetical protein